MKYRIEIEQDEDGMFIATVPSLPGCISQGANRLEAMKNIKDAANGYIQSLLKHDEPVPRPIDEDVIEIA